VADEIVRFELRDNVAIAHVDDGKANALSHDVVAALGAHLDRAEKEAAGVLICGRPGMLSGGFDLAVMRGGPEGVYGLVKAGAELFLRFLDFPLPIVIGASGHAIAAGCILLLAADARIGAAGKFKIGLNEVGAGMTLPVFAIELARRRLSKRHFVRATTQAELYAPEVAVDAGYLDRVTSPEDLFDAALAEASRLAALPQPAFGATKRGVHGAFAANLRETLAADLKRLTGTGS
jgi:enoyl-CoA hydratase